MAKILVVDDDLNIRKVLHSLLSGSNHEVLEAGDGLAASRIAASEHPDAIFLDVVMPGMGGMAALDQLKKNPETANIPVIMLTAHNTEQVRDRCRSKGADQFLAKPWSPGELESAIRQALGYDSPEDRISPEGSAHEQPAEGHQAGARNAGLRISNLKAVAEEFIGSQLGISVQVQQQVIGQVSLRIKSTTREGASKVYRLEGTARINSSDKSQFSMKRFYLTVVADQGGQVIDRYGQVMDEHEVNVR